MISSGNLSKTVDGSSSSMSATSRSESMGGLSMDDRLGSWSSKPTSSAAFDMSFWRRLARVSRVVREMFGFSDAFSVHAR